MGKVLDFPPPVELFPVACPKCECTGLVLWEERHAACYQCNIAWSVDELCPMVVEFEPEPAA